MSKSIRILFNCPGLSPFVFVSMPNCHESSSFNISSCVSLRCCLFLPFCHFLSCRSMSLFFSLLMVLCRAGIILSCALSLWCTRFIERAVRFINIKTRANAWSLLRTVVVVADSWFHGTGAVVFQLSVTHYYLTDTQRQRDRALCSGDSALQFRVESNRNGNQKQSQRKIAWYDFIYEE